MYESTCENFALRQDPELLLARNKGKAPLTYRGFEKLVAAVGPPPAPCPDPPALLPPPTPAALRADTGCARDCAPAHAPYMHASHRVHAQLSPHQLPSFGVTDVSLIEAGNLRFTESVLWPRTRIPSIAEIGGYTGEASAHFKVQLFQDCPPAVRLLEQHIHSFMRVPPGRRVSHCQWSSSSAGWRDCGAGQDG